MPFMINDKLKLYYEIHGSGPRLVFHPGTASDLRIKPSIFNSPLADYFEILSFDPRGIGQSNSPDAKPTMLDYATDLKKLLDYLGWTKCHLVGESFGGMVAQEFAINYKEYLDRLVLVVTSSGGAGGSSFPYHEHDISAMTDEQKANFWVECADSRARDKQWKIDNPDTYQQQFELYLSVFKQNAANPDKATFSARQINARKGHNTYSRLNTIKTETYLCGGHYDYTAPIQNQLALLDKISNSRLTLFNGSHMLLWQDNFAFTSIVNFLQQPRQ